MELTMIGGQPYMKQDGNIPQPVVVKDVILDYINIYTFPQNMTPEDLKHMEKMMTIGEKLYQGCDELVLEDTDFDFLKDKIMKPPMHIKVASVIVQVMRIFDDAEDVKV